MAMVPLHVYFRQVGLALIISMILSFAGTACSVKTTEAVNSGAFITDRISTVRIDMKPEDWATMLNNAYAEEYAPADFSLDGELVRYVGVRPKGNSSLGQAVGWDSPRIPLAVDFNLLNKARTFRGVKKVFLNNGWSDPTLIRERLAYDIFSQMDIPTPRSSLVDVFVNNTHLGVYTMVEMIDTNFLSQHYGDSSGKLYKPDVMSALLDWTEDDLATQRIKRAQFQTKDPNAELNINLGGGRLLDILRALGEEESVAGYTPGTPIPDNPRGLPPGVIYRDFVDAMNLKTNEDNPDNSALFHFLKILNEEPDETFVQEIEKVLDVDETLRFIAVSGVLVHLDNYTGVGHNTNFYEVNGKFSVIPWDMNMAFGTFNSGIRKDGLINFYVDEPTAGPMFRYPLVDRLLSHPPFLEKYREYVKQIMDGPFSPAVMEEKINQLSSLVEPFAANDPEYFYAPGDWKRCLTEDLRPPDAFEGWMAGGMSPMLPWPTSKERISIKQEFGVEDFWSLLGYNFQPGDLEKLKTILPEYKYKTFLQNLYGPLEAPQPPGQPGYGPNSLGLRSFIIERYNSIRQQLSGERASKSGSKNGNGGSMWIADWSRM